MVEVKSYSLHMETINKYRESNPAIRDAVVCFIQKDDKVLLGVRKTSSTNLGINRVAGLGGKLENGETKEQALVRELQEEVGITLTEFEEHGQVTFLYPHKPEWSQEVTVYIGTKWEGDPTETEETCPSWFDINDLPVDRMFVENRLWVPQVLEGKYVYAAFLFNEEHKVIDSKIEILDEALNLP